MNLQMEKWWGYRYYQMYNNIGAAIAGYIIKRMEANLRELTNFKSKLSPNIRTVLLPLENSGNLKNKELYHILKNSEFDLCIDNAVDKFFNNTYSNLHKDDIASVPIFDVKIDISKLEKIRQESLDTQNRLIIEEINEDNMQAKGIIQTAPVSDFHQINKEQDTDVWVCLSKLLSEAQIRALQVICNSRNVNGELREISKLNKGILVEVLLESINEAALECIGDNIIETAASPVYVYEDYIKDVQRIVRRY